MALYISDDVVLKDNKIYTAQSNANLELSANSSGVVHINDSLKIGTGASVTTILDEDAMGTNSATSLATQQSIKAYVDSRHTGGTVTFTGASTDYLTISKSTNDAVLHSQISDGDILFKGNDGGATITAFWLNMSEAGDAHFNADVNVGNDLMVEDYIWMENDSQSMYWGSDSEVRFRHVHNEGLRLENRLGTDDTPIVLTLRTLEEIITVGEKIGVINFQAPSEASGTDAILVAAGIEAVAEGTFAADSNATKLSFKTASSETAAEKMSLSSGGNLTISGDLTTGEITITDNEITTSSSNANLELSANSSGYVQIMGTGAMVLPASTTANRPTGVTGMIRHNTTTGNFEGYDGSSWGSLAGSTSASEDSDNTATKTKVQIGTSVVNIDTWTTSSYWGAKYNYVAYDEVNSEMQTGIIHIVHDSTTAYMSEYGITHTGSSIFLTFTVDISGGYVRLRGVGDSTTNSVTAFRTALGSSSSADSSSTNTGLTLVSDLDSSQASLDTTAFATYRGVSYLCVAQNAGSTDDSTVGYEIVKINATHNGTTAYHSEFGVTSTTTARLVSYDVDINGSDLRLLGTSAAANTVIKIYKVMVKDTEEAATSDSVNIITNTDVDSAIENIDTFENSVDEDTTFQAVHYFNTVKSADEEEYQVSDVLVVGDGGTNIYVSEYGKVESGGRELLTYTSDYSNTTGRLRGVGATTDLVVNGYRINLKRKGGGVSAASTVLTSSTQTVAGLKTFSSAIAMTVGSDPSGVANNAHIYSKDDTSSAEVYVRDEAGNVTKLSPHNKQGEWEYFSRNVSTGKTVRVNMEEMIKDIEKLTGKKYIKDE